MPRQAVPRLPVAVALRKESVDRNSKVEVTQASGDLSLSARRAWIEIGGSGNNNVEAYGRSPQGEHGMFLFLTVQGGFIHADIRFDFENCYNKKLSHKII